MTLEKHNLVQEFPEYKQRIHELKISDNHFARLSADLPVFLRQSHAERDLAALGQRIAGQSCEVWAL